MVRSESRHIIHKPKDCKPFEKEAIQSTLVHRFEEIAEMYQDRVAIRSESESITYRQLNEGANMLARKIVSSKTTQPVAFTLEQEPSAIIALLGILKAGKSYVALDPTFPVERLRQVVNSIRAGLILTNNRNLSLTSSLIDDRAGVEVLNLDYLEKDTPRHNLGVPTDPDAIAYIVFTSGSTGLPKGVIRTHRISLHDVYTQTCSLYIVPSDRFALFLSVSYEASRFALLGSLLNGATLCLFDPKKYGLHLLPEWMENEQITILLSTPSAFRRMFDRVTKNKRFSSVRLINLSGEVATSQDLQLFNQHFSRNCTLINSLGVSEAGALARYALPYNASIPGYIVPVGYPVLDKQILLVNSDNQIIHDDQIGEILVKSEYISPGYWNQPDLTAERFSIDPEDDRLHIYRTGDLGRWRSDGYLEYLGRKDTQVKIRGFRIEVEEIEAVLHQNPAVKDACVIAWADESNPEEKQLVAYVVPEHAGSVQEGELRKFVATNLPHYMIPRKFILLEKLPLTPTGKVNRLELPAPDGAFQEKERQYTAPKDEIETQLVKIWERVLKIKPVGTQDDFFALGGNSLLAAQLFAQVEKTLGKKLPLATLFQAPTIEQQADFIRQEDWVPDWSSLVALRTGGYKPPLFFAAPVGGNVLSYRDLMMQLAHDQPCYGLQAVGLDGVQTPLRSVTEVAAHYIKEILTLQPDGPYHLCGSSFGGLVAYEMAQQLHDMGKYVALAVMFDAYGPNYPTRLPSTSRLRRKTFKVLRRIDTHVSNLLATNWKGRRIYFQAKIPKLYMRLSRRFHNKIEQVLHPVPSQLRHIRAVHMGAAKRKRRYMREPRRFPGRLVLFRAEKQPLGIYPDPKLGWGAVVGDDIEVYEIPGHHTSIIYQPRVQILAEKLNQILTEVQENHRGNDIMQ